MPSEFSHRRRTQVDVVRGELLDQRAQSVGPGELRDQVAELEVLEDVLDVGREPVEVVLEVGPELLLAGPRLQVVQGELRGVVERLARRIPQRFFLLDDPLLVEPGLHAQDSLLRGFQHRVEAAQHGHGQDDVAVLAADVDVAEHVVRDAPDVVGDPVEVGGGGRRCGHVCVVVGVQLNPGQVSSRTQYIMSPRGSLESRARRGPPHHRRRHRFVRHFRAFVADKSALPPPQCSSLPVSTYSSRGGPRRKSAGRSTAPTLLGAAAGRTGEEGASRSVITRIRVSPHRLAQRNGVRHNGPTSGPPLDPIPHFSSLLPVASYRSATPGTVHERRQRFR